MTQSYCSVLLSQYIWLGSPHWCLIPSLGEQQEPGAVGWALPRLLLGVSVGTGGGAGVQGPGCACRDCCGERQQSPSLCSLHGNCTLPVTWSSGICPLARDEPRYGFDSCGGINPWAPHGCCASIPRRAGTTVKQLLLMTPIVRAIESGLNGCSRPFPSLAGGD